MKRHTNPRPFVIERWSTTALEWVFVCDEKSSAAAEQYIARKTAAHIFDKYRIVKREVA